MANCSNEMPQTDVFYGEISGDTTIIVSLVFASILTLVCIVIYIEEILFFMRSYDDKSSRVITLLTLLGLFPVICVLALISVLVPTSKILTDFTASCYLSVCMYTFVHMTIGFFGGDEAMVNSFKGEKLQLNTPPCCCICCCLLKPITLTKSSLIRIKLCSLQVIVVRPLLLFTGAVLWTDGKYEHTISPTSAYTYISVLSGVSTILSVYGMVVIFRASRVKLKHHSLTLKFIPVQLCVVLLNLQNFVFNALAERGVPVCVGSRGPSVRMAEISHSVLIVEMVLLSLLARKGYRRFDEDESPQVISKASDESADRQKNGIDHPIDKYGSFDNL